MIRTFALLVALQAGSQPAGPNTPVTVGQIIYRENPDFSIQASLSAGRDGRLYFASGGNHSYVLGVRPDGAAKTGAPVTYACANAVANSAGIIATASGHFAHKVTLYDREFKELSHVDDFLVSDQVGWDAPAHVEAGTSGDFFAVDQHRNRIVRINPAGKVVTSYPIPHEPEGGQGLVEDFRVWEKGETFFILNREGQIRSISFDGRKKWTLKPGVWPGNGGFDADESGTLFAISRDSDVLRKYSPQGEPAGEVRLQMLARKPKAGEHGFTGLRLQSGEAILKRQHPTELFERYSLSTGALGQVVGVDHERLAITFPQRLWTAGETIPFTIEFSPGGRTVKPSWKVWLRALRSPIYHEALVKDGQLSVPVDLAGLVEVKVTPEVEPAQKGRPSEYLVQTVIEIRKAGTTAFAAVVLSGNRTEFARGEEIPFTILGSAPHGEVQLMDQDHLVTSITADSGRLSRELTATLAPGAYRLVPVAPGMTVVPAPLIIGPGLESTAFMTIQYGDYGPTYPSASVDSSPDIVAAHVARMKKLGFTMAVDRIGSPTEINDLAWTGREAAQLTSIEKQFPELAGTVRVESPLLRTMSGYSAQGIQEMAILMYMDAGLPLGAPGFDSRKPDELTRTIARVTSTLRPYPAFRGWSWASNWWVFEGRGSKAARTPEQKSAYEAALKRAKETGAWDPVLDEVANRRLSWAVEAQESFNASAKPLAPHMVTAVAGPYRNVEAYPPITFSNVDEVDLQAQWEQVALPYHAPHSVDFYRRPGKRAWVHPEVWNDSGTGDQILPTLLTALERGADGVGVSGSLAPWMSGQDGLPHDSRSAHYGTVSVFRALTELLRDYGSWWTALESRDPVAIVADGRMFKIDDWLGQGVTGKHFARVFEAWCTCLHAHLPATYVYPEEVSAAALKRFRAVLLVGQQVQLEPSLAAALKDAGVPVYADGTCRPEVVREYVPLGLAFDHVEKDSHPASDDAAYWRFPQYLRPGAQALRKILAPGQRDLVENSEVFVSERISDQGRYVFVVNNTTPQIEPGQLWRQTLFVATRMPVVASLNLGDGHVYDAFSFQNLRGEVQADLRSLPARLFAILPSAIDRLDLRCSPIKPGERVSWEVRILDPEGKPIRASIPIRVRLMNGPSLLEEWTGGAGSGGAHGSFLVPLNAAPLSIDAVELLSGKTGGSTKVPPIEHRFGPHLRDLALIDHGRTALLNAMNWDHNLYAVDVETGALRWRQRAGQGFAFSPLAIQDGFAVQGFHFDTAEGYQLHLGKSDGTLERRFPLYGLPGRLPHRFVPGIQRDRMNHFAAPESGAWIASSGDLGLAVWSREGKLLWSVDRWKSTRRADPIAALDDVTLIVVEGMKARAHEAATGKIRWEVPLAATGEVTQIRVTRDGKACALLATTEGGRLFILRDGSLVACHITGGGTDIDLCPDGSRVALVTGNLLKLYSSTEGLRWTLSGDDFLRFPRFSPDGARVAASSDLGTLFVADVSGTVLLERDLGSVAVPAWLPGGDLLLATWMGRVTRLTPSFDERWTALLRPESKDAAGFLLSEDRTPLAVLPAWTNSEPTPLPLSPNLLSEKEVLIRMVAQQNHIQFVRPTGMLVDGKADPPAEPWLNWGDIGSFAETSPFNYVLIDTFRSRLRVSALTLVEDPAHPESWLRDLRFEVWNPAREQWEFVQDLRSNSSVHTHRFTKPVEGARFRLVLPWGVCGNLRLAEIVLHGSKLGGSHPDVIAKRRTAVLFDEGDDLKGNLVYGPLSFKFDGAFTGGRCLALSSNSYVAALYQPPFGHVLPNWDFEIVEKPEPGQYRWAQFSWRAQGPDTKGMTLSLWGAQYGERALFHAGVPSKEEGAIPRKISDAPPLQWETVRVDLWGVYQKPVRIRSMALGCTGGSALFDQVLLAREEKDLPPRK